ncbi:hypothetical protein A6E01_20585 (plasmid) [Vibrio breoganii]|uniref:TfoX C-terminal domain-containing protein n=1 Tax=Vibrio breoganii TaxID=553239 RepID=A0AAN0XZX2_9VIBR|nr:TfoX/Sxy family DNA transformation protein [Vibrio breoganii]ANO35611.1 hypothetical protein A6E01_20585 [Vibrio breoganii]
MQQRANSEWVINFIESVLSAHTRGSQNKTRIGTMFGGQCIFYGVEILGELCAEGDGVYLRARRGDCDAFTRQRAQPKGTEQVYLEYYHVSTEWLKSNQDRAADLIQRIYDRATLERHQRKQPKLSTYLNFSRTIANLLKKVGVTSVDEFMMCDPYVTFARIRQEVSKEASPLVLVKFVATKTNRHLGLVPKSEQSDIKQKFFSEYELAEEA